MRKTEKSISLLVVLCLFPALIMLSGCETVTAFSSGRMHASDVMYIVKAQNTQLSDAQYSALKPGQDIECDYGNYDFWGQLQKTDAWINQNLW